MTDQSLPLWADAGMHGSGAAWEALDWDGAPVASDQSRVRVQARQLFSFSLAHGLGWAPARSAALVEGLFELIVRACRRDDGLYGRRIDLSKQQLVEDTPDLYDNAFVLLGLAHARAVLGAATVDPAIDELLQALDSGLSRGPALGFREFLPAPSYRLQNPHMHLFESTLALYAATRSESVRQRAATLQAFIEKTFFDESVACVNEYANSDVSSHNGFFEPGHSMEWAWLLGWHARLCDQPYPAFGRQLYERAVAVLDANGRAPMQVTSAGEPLDPSRRLWAQTEALKAHLCMVEQCAGDKAHAAAERAVACCRGIVEEWLQPALAGGWLDHFDQDGTLVARNMPTSSGYHVYCAIAELQRVSRAFSDAAGQP